MAEQSAESGRVFVEHEVSFHLAPADRFVLPRRHIKGYVSVGYITVHLMHDQRVWLTASGSVCKKDGTPSAVTSMNESVDLPDEAYWVERAKAALIDGSPHCPTCQCIHEACGYVIGSLGCEATDHSDGDGCASQS